VGLEGIFLGRAVRRRKSGESTGGRISRLVHKGLPTTRSEPFLKRDEKPLSGEVLEKSGLKEEDYEKLKSYWIENKNKFLMLKEPSHVRKTEENKLPRSMVVVPSGPKQGMYVLLKSKGGMQEVGLGSFNRVTLALNIETGEIKAFRSGKVADETRNEMEANKSYAEIDPGQKYFVTGVPVTYRGPLTSRTDRVARMDKSTFPHEKDVEKVGYLMDLVEGDELWSLLYEEESLKETLPKLEILRHLVEGLVLAHKKGIVNLDIKTENVMVGKTDGIPKMVDFGFAYKVGSVVKELQGTPGMLSPEVVQASKEEPLEVEPANEMWIVGCMMAEMLKGPKFIEWLGQGALETLHRVTVESLLDDAVYEYFPDWCKEGTIDHMIAGCLQYHPEDRRSASELHAQISSLIDNLPKSYA